MPGAISPATGLVKNANSTWLIGRPLDRDLEARLGRPVRLANDANCFALSEASDGAAAGAPVVFGVIVGTGCGGGVVVHGQVLTGPNAIAGEWGHNPLPWPAQRRTAGPASATAASAAASRPICQAPAWSRDYARASAGGRTRPAITGATVVARAAGGDRHAAAALDRYAHRLARGLATVINALDPDVIVLGGGVSNVAMLYEAVPRLLDQFVFSDRRVDPHRAADAWGFQRRPRRGVAVATPRLRDSTGSTQTGIRRLRRLHRFLLLRRQRRRGGSVVGTAAADAAVGGGELDAVQQDHRRHVHPEQEDHDGADRARGC